ncbi:hypothetical protein K2X33_03845 [bacterium]|nr:hypothetical protein [bacterium]
MKKLLLGTLALLSLGTATPSFANGEEARFYDVVTVYVGRGWRARNVCDSYKGTRVTVEGDMRVLVQDTRYYYNGNCDLYY